MVQNIILDTNFLLIPYQFNVDIFAEIARICNFKYELAVLDRTLDELNSIIEKQKGKYKSAASFGLQLLKGKSLKIIRTHSQKPVDDLLVEHAEKGDIIATQDSALKQKIKGKTGKIIILRNKKFLKFE